MKDRIFYAIRWIALVPLSALVGWAAFALLTVSWQMIVPSYGALSALRNPIRFLIEFFATGLMGAVFAWTAAFIAPSAKKKASYVSCGLAGGISLVSAGIGLSQGNMRAVVLTLPLVIGLAWACFEISKHEAFSERGPNNDS